MFDFYVSGILRRMNMMPFCGKVILMLMNKIGC